MGVRTEAKKNEVTYCLRSLVVPIPRAPGHNESQFQPLLLCRRFDRLVQTWQENPMGGLRRLGAAH